jgi:DNA-binding winged helix-turn-helix (wHTH) protein
VRYRFERCEVDAGRRELVVDGAPVRVEPQVLDVLLVLLERRHRVVSKSELLDLVWGDQFVSESALTSRVKSARRALGDDGSAQRMIRTAHGHGHRFVADVQVVDDVARAEESPRLPEPATVAPRVRLPAPPRTALVGRDGDRAAVRSRLERYRLVTITGPGGAGKSRLALDLAWTRLTEGGAVAFAELAPVQDDAGVLRAVAAVGLEGAAAAERTALAHAVAHRDLLLVLDNCEHVIEQGARLVDALLDIGPQGGR